MPIRTDHYKKDPGKKYGVILADPPWSYSNRGVNGAAEKHYKTMTPKEIKLLPVLQYAEENCVLVLWTTNPMLPVALDVMETWGFVFVTAFPWIKFTGNPKFDVQGNVVDGRVSWGTGFWVRGCSEIILIGKKGNARPPQRDFLGILSDRLPHSKKPDTIYDYCESMDGPYLELFARENRPGWDVWGDEVENSITLEQGINIPDLDKFRAEKGKEIRETWSNKQNSHWIVGDAIRELVKSGMKLMDAYRFAASQMVGVNSIYWPRLLYKVALMFPKHERKMHSRSWGFYRREYERASQLAAKSLKKKREQRNANRQRIEQRVERPGE